MDNLLAVAVLIDSCLIAYMIVSQNKINTASLESKEANFKAITQQRTEIEELKKLVHVSNVK